MCNFTNKIPWNFDIEESKTQGRILCCVEDDQNWYGFTWWNQAEQRWVMLATDQEPMCWIKVEHPYEDED